MPVYRYTGIDMTKHYICIEYTYTIYNDILPVFRYTSIDIATIIYV